MTISIDTKTFCNDTLQGINSAQMKTSKPIVDIAIVEENWNDLTFNGGSKLLTLMNHFIRILPIIIMARDKLFKDFHYTPGDIPGGHP